MRDAAHDPWDQGDVGAASRPCMSGNIFLSSTWTTVRGWYACSRTTATQKGSRGKLERRNKVVRGDSRCIQWLCFWILIYLYILFHTIYLDWCLILCLLLCDMGISHKENLQLLLAQLLCFCQLIASGFFWGGWGGDELQQYEDKTEDVYWFSCPDSQGMNKTDK